MKRFGQVIRVRPEFLEKYKEYHKEVWPDILKQIKDSNISNYSIYYKDSFLFAYFEYTGQEFEKDMAQMAEDPRTQEWWAIMKPMQEPLETREEGEWWADMEEVFHLD